MKGKLPWVSAITELVGLTAIGAGIALEVIYKAEVYCLVITFSSLILASGGMLWAKIYRGGR